MTPRIPETMSTDPAAAPPPGPDDSDDALMTRLAAGEDTALNELMRRWRARIASFLAGMTGDHTTALDLTQETFVRLYRSRSRYRPAGQFSAWIFTVAANLARDHARWRARHPTTSLEEESLPPLPEPAPAPDESAHRSEHMARVHQALSRLPADLREAMLLFAWEDLSYAEIARIADCSPKAAEMRIYRARQLLKQALAAEA